MDYPQNDIIRIDDILNHEACQFVCQIHLECQFWIYNNDTNSNKDCWLKNQKGDSTLRTQMISGPKFCNRPTDTHDRSTPFCKILIISFPVRSYEDNFLFYLCWSILLFVSFLPVAKPTGLRAHFSGVLGGGGVQ